MSDRPWLPNLTYAKIAELMAGQSEYVFRHTAIMTQPDASLCSGVYIKLFGYYGILTAAHCPEKMMKKPKLCLAISGSWHQCIVDWEKFEYFPIDRNNMEPGDGNKARMPDLAVLIIKDTALVKAIEQSGLAFLDVNKQNYNIFFDGTGVVGFTWWLIGSPGDNVKQSSTGHSIDSSHLIKIETMGMQAQFDSYVEGQLHDYILLKLPNGTNGFPKDYQGVSGGGIWYFKFNSQNAIDYTVEPILAGIAISQMSDSLNSENQIITGHYARSIYCRVRDLFAQKHFLENTKALQ